jgi:hypothetical protein
MFFPQGRSIYDTDDPPVVLSRDDAIEISNAAGLMLRKVEERVSFLHGLPYPVDVEFLPVRDRELVVELRRLRQSISDRLV